MRSSRELFERLPRERQDEVLDLLLSALKWRGIESSRVGIQGMVLAKIEEIAKIYSDNRMEIEEYT